MSNKIKDPTPASACCWFEGDDLLLHVRIQPRASREGIGEVFDGRLKINVSAAPVNEAANRRLVMLLAKEFGVARSSVEIIVGQKSRNKRLRISRPSRRPGWMWS